MKKTSLSKEKATRIFNDLERVRVYVKDKTPYLSVTTILGLYFPFNVSAWNQYLVKNDLVEKSKQILRLGNKIHDWADCAIKGVPIELWPTPLNQKEEDYCNSISKYCSTQKWLQGDTMVCNKEVRYIGRLDAEQLEHFVDFKTFDSWTGKENDQTEKKVAKTNYQLTMYGMGEKRNKVVRLAPPLGECIETVFEPDLAFLDVILKDKDIFNTFADEAYEEILKGKRKGEVVSYEEVEND